MGPSDLSLRRATASDIPHFARIDAATDAQAARHGHPEFDDGNHIPDDVAAAAVTQGAIRVAEVDGVVVGWIHCGRASGELSVEQISVLPEHQQRGIGSAMMRAVIDDARIAGEATIVLNTQRDLVWNMPWYESLGFREVPEAEWTPAMAATTEQQAATGLDWATRVHLRLHL